MSADERLVELATAFERVGLSFLVMGGHAVRYYGVSRDTFDFDFHLSLAASHDLPERLQRTLLFGGGPPPELPSWRGEDFRRFLLGRLPNGKEEWLEFWFRNHLLAPYEVLQARREDGDVAGKRLRFLALPDLIRSKETERESDWLDVALLEEILDARNLTKVDMLDMEGNQRLMLLVKPAVLAAIPRPCKDPSARCGVHQDTACCFNQRRALACSTEIRSTACT